MNLICLIRNHDWKEIPGYMKTRECKRCGRIEIYAHMNYEIGWKWIKSVNE